MGKWNLSRREWGIVLWFALACASMVLAVAEWWGGGANVLDYVELSFLALVMSRVL